jgi:hypothetical protein
MTADITDPIERKYKYHNCIPDCPKCGGIGYIYRKARVGQPDFGKMDKCPNKPITLAQIEKNGLDETDRTMSWDALIENEGIIIMKTYAKAMLAKGHGMIYIHGQPGNGKTTCAKLALMDALKLGWTGQYLTHVQMIEWLRSSFDTDFGQQEYRYRMKMFANKRLLVIDEVNRARETDFSIQTFSEVLDTRYTSAVRELSCTIFVSNFAPEDCLDDYQIDRIRDKRFEVLRITDGSMRG